MGRKTTWKVLFDIIHFLKKTAITLLIELLGIAAFIGLLCIERSTTGIAIEIDDIANLKMTAIAFAAGLYILKTVFDEEIIGKVMSFVISSAILIFISYSVEMISNVSIITILLFVLEPVTKGISAFLRKDKEKEELLISILKEMKNVRVRGLNTKKKRWSRIMISHDGVHYYGGWENIDQESLGLDSGLCDQKYKEIYDGDLLEVEREGIREVMLVRNGFYKITCDNKRIPGKGFYLLDINGKEHSLIKLYKSAKVVGNMYENPELFDTYRISVQEGAQ